MQERHEQDSAFEAGYMQSTGAAGVVSLKHDARVAQMRTTRVLKDCESLVEKSIYIQGGRGHVDIMTNISFQSDALIKSRTPQKCPLRLRFRFISNLTALISSLLCNGHRQGEPCCHTSSTNGSGHQKYWNGNLSTDTNVNRYPRKVISLNSTVKSTSRFVCLGTCCAHVA
jgi:hypothetical protein